MVPSEQISPAEMASLREIAKGVFQRFVPVEHARRLLAAKLIYVLLGELRITTQGRNLIGRQNAASRR